MELTLRTMLPVAAASLLLGACASAPSPQGMMDAGVEPVSTEQLYAMHEGDPTRVSWTNPAGGSGTAEFYLDGTWIVEWASGSDRGEYYIAAGKLCDTLDRTRPEGRCVTYYPTGSPDEYHAFSDDGAWVGTLVYEQ